MAFNRPTLTALIDRVLADITSRFATAGSVLRRSVLGVLGRAIAGAAHELYGYISYLARQVIIDTADADYLERWASIWGVGRKAAEYAEGLITFTGVNGSPINDGALVQRQDGARFSTIESGYIASGVASIPVRAIKAGAAGNTSAGVTLSLVSPIAGIQSATTVGADGISNGSDTEDDDSLRARLLDRIQDPPHGGSKPDYVSWALDVPGVTRAWVSPMEMGAGTVTVRFVRDGDLDNIPGDAEIQAVSDYIEERRPVTAEVFVVAPVPVLVPMTIQIAPDTSAVRAAVTAELEDLFTRVGEPGGTVLKSHIDEAISIAPGETDHVLVTPSANVVLSAGQIAKLGAISWGPIA